MGTRAAVETRRDRKALVADAGYKPLSIVSVLAGVLTSYGLFAVLAGLTVGILAAVDADVDLTSQWPDLGVAGGLVVAGLLLLAYLFGGYVAGRMARRSGVLHGLVVFVLGVALAAGAAWLARELGGDQVATDNLRNLGLPTTGAEWRDVATVAGIASLAAMLVGALLGGLLGERWHDKLLRRALDPNVGAEADARRDAARRAARAEELRTGSYERVRATSPTRTTRVDRDADNDGIDDRDETREVRVPATSSVAGFGLAGDSDRDRQWDPRGRRDVRASTGNGSSFWHRRRHTEAGNGVDTDGDGRVDLAKDRRTARSAGRTG